MTTQLQGQDESVKFDGIVKNPTFMLCCISKSFNVR